LAKINALDARDHADPEHGAAADRVVGVVSGQRADLEERAVGVEREGEPLAHRELSALGEAGVVLGAAARFGFDVQAVDLGQLLEHGGAVFRELGAARVQAGADRRGEQGGLHRVHPLRAPVDRNMARAVT
jgi:hypothetical protein